ncbi:hypothetical protein [Haloarchaeobius sp. DFWS5]|uniref:hypothetical protein n=1 Tax=Haloarchaeobius sp. DFWS5 TaxID=3446114 RepID=UPI003EBAD6B5
MDVPRDRLLLAIGASVGSFLVFGAVTGLLRNPLYVRMVPRTGLDYVFLTLTAGFIGLYALQRPGTRRRGDDGIASVGAVAGVLAFGCPICNGLLLALFSSSALMTYFDPLRPLVGALSVLLFGTLLYVRSSRQCETCVGDDSRSHTHD